MNAVSLLNLVARRIPSYDPSEYLSEINAAYKECWDYILQLDDSYFTDIKIVTVTTAASEFDFLYNSNGALSGPVSPRYFQIDRIRILQPGDVNWYSANPRPWNDPWLLGQQQLNPQPTAIAPPYLYNPFAKGSIKFGAPFPVGTQIEVIYSFFFLPLSIISTGTITTNGTTGVVNGTGTNFTQSVGPDYAGALPGIDQDTDVGLDFVIGSVTPNNNGLSYRVKSVQNDTLATTWTVIIPAVTNSAYSLAIVPDIPEGHHNVIATLATRNFMSTPANDSRLPFWVAQAEKELDSMRDSVMTRQRQAPARRGRFPQSAMRYNTGVPATGR